MADKAKKNFFKQLKKRYRLSLYDEHTLLEVWSSLVTRLRIYNIILIYSVFVIAIFTLVLIFTPLNRILPAYADSEMQEKIIVNAIRVDSLEHQIMVRDKYFENIKRIMEGKMPEDEGNNVKLTENEDGFDIFLSKHDSLLLEQIEEEERFNLSLDQNSNGEVNMSNIHFYTPVKGMITNRFDAEKKHFGIDIVSSPKQPILAALDGTVILSTWTITTGYVIEIQHSNNIISFYKHNSALLKQVGDHIMAGEAIAIIGNTGELSTGAHLHFELWHNGAPVNPEDYILF